jgi:hypothetical protein
VTTSITILNHGPQRVRATVVDQSGDQHHYDIAPGTFTAPHSLSVFYGHSIRLDEIKDTPKESTSG